MTEFTGKTAVVTGATRGIGRAIAESFLQQNCKVVGVYGSNQEEAKRFQNKWSEDQLQLERCDVADHEQVARFYEQLESRFDTLDILVNNAGVRKDAIVALMNSEQWQQVIDINLSGTFHMSKYAIPLMLKQKFGRIVNITSPSSHMGIQGQANYAASKAGQIGFTRTLAKEVARKKITVNCVSPGFIKTDLLEDLADEQLSAYKKMVPMRRFGDVGEVVAAVQFLASEKASYITGSVLDVNGGL
ncbi:MAG: SDR family oxidoreductase [Desulfofustis sp.]|nr:SDR family oxidoreductase [Desulfofustis sp.]NNK55989.1 SDR family oxidoreductase [Desulfofustis sp.]